jgi:nicotinamidase-related amidase
MYKELPIPPVFDEEIVPDVRRVDYQEISQNAKKWAEEKKLKPAFDDQTKICLLLVDCQNTFCTPGHELFVAGRSGNAAVEDSKRICKFIYKNMGLISNITASMDTHKTMQVFHPFFLVDSEGNHPDPMTIVSSEDVKDGKWKVNPDAAENIPDKDYESLQKFLYHYCKELEDSGKLQLMIWPYHAMLGGIGHALVSAIEEALFFYSIARKRQPTIEVKGENTLTENYSIFRPEVTEDERKQKIASENKAFFDNLLSHDRIIIAGQAKSHCVAWTVEDFLAEIKSRDPGLTKKVYLMEDCTSPVVIPDAVDFTEEADRAFQKFSDAGMNLVRSTDPVALWPGMDFLKQA